jgi:membrane dipeptidase
MRLIVDGHLDLASNALSHNRDITRPLEEVRRAEAGMTDLSDRGLSTVTLPEMRKAGVAVCIATLIARSGPVPPRKPPLARTDLDYASQPIAHAIARGQLAYYQLLEQLGEIRILRTDADLQDHWNQWKSPPARLGAPPIGVIIGMECADPILEPTHLRGWWELGLRNIEPAHYGASHYAAGNTAPGSLTPMGVALLQGMQELQMLLDVTHLSDASMSEALDLYEGPILASHHNCRTLCDNERQLSDEHIRRLIERDGVIGAALHNGMLHPQWKEGHTPRQLVTMQTVALHIDHVCQIAGDSRHAAIGSDMDGGFGTEAMPYGIDSIVDLHKLAEPLDRRGYSSDDLDNIFHANWLRLLRRGLPAG